jgi:hypothetical protein
MYVKEIKYPTGGKTKFDFERAYVDNLYRGIDSGGYIGGFRVSKIANYFNENDIADIKSYQYGTPKYNIIDPEFYSYPQWYIDLGNMIFVQLQKLVGYIINVALQIELIVSTTLCPGCLLLIWML